jgi:hypothetical protein
VNVVGTQALCADSYMLSGCWTDEICGVFTRVEAHCAAGSGARCPGGTSAAGSADPTLCDGAPVYQNAHSMVLHRVSEGGSTRWYVSESGALADCEFHGGIYSGTRPRTDLIPGRLGPTAPVYGQWSTPHYHESISVVAGGGR